MGRLHGIGHRTCLALLGLVVGVSPATSSPSDETTNPLGVPVTAGAPPGFDHVPFTAYAADPGSFTFDDLDTDEKADSEAQQTRTSNDGHDAGFETLRAAIIDARNRTRANAMVIELGLEGFSDDGVVP